MTGRKGVRSRVVCKMAHAYCLSADCHWGVEKEPDNLHQPTVGEAAAEHIMKTGHRVKVTRTRETIVYRWNDIGKGI
ncbi:hypothetical protein LCGC14_2093760 [marine sediment metagenome]|uniref:Uncharacterized protein n=1 Tax=marine sediment metagenome TaxID=412755 RepID=A0A0F9EBX3_9ZZZZ